MTAAWSKWLGWLILLTNQLLAMPQSTGSEHHVGEERAIFRHLRDDEEFKLERNELLNTARARWMNIRRR